MTFSDVVRWLEQAPPDTLLPARSLLAMLRDALPATDKAPLIAELQPPPWRERLWTVPDDTRLGVTELSEAIGRPVSWVYRHCSPASGLPQLPHRKLDGSLTFVAAQIREWIREHEASIVEPSAAVVSIRRRR